MGGVVDSAVNTVSNVAGGLPIVGGMARGAIGQGRSALGGMGLPGGQQGGGGGLFGGGKGSQGGQGGPGGMLGGLMGGKGGQQNPFNQFAQGAANFANNQNPFGGGRLPSGHMPGFEPSGGGVSPSQIQGGFSRMNTSMFGAPGGVPNTGRSGWGNNFGMGQPQSLAQRRIAARHAQMGQGSGQPPNAQTASMSSDFMNQYK